MADQLVSLAPEFDEYLRRRPMTPEQTATSRRLTAAGVVGLARNAAGLIDLGPDGDDNGGRLVGVLRGWKVWQNLSDEWLARDLRMGRPALYAGTLAHAAALAWLEENG